MRIGMRLLLGYFLIVAVAAWFVLSIFVQEIKPGVRRATEGTLIPPRCWLRWRVMTYFLTPPLTVSWRRHFPNCITAHSAPISVALTRCVMNTMST